MHMQDQYERYLAAIELDRDREEEIWRAQQIKIKVEPVNDEIPEDYDR